MIEEAKYCIAERNPKTGKFTLESEPDDERKIRWMTMKTAQMVLGCSVRMHGQENTMLLQSVSIKVEVGVTIKE